MRVNGVLRVPGDKSISHRALMLAALAQGRSRVRGVLDSADVRSTASVLRALGVAIPELAPEMEIAGVGLRGLRTPGGALDCGNSGTTTRLVAGIVAGSNVTATFVGDASLSRRPMQRIARPLTAMGARFVFERGDGLPMTITGGANRSIDWTSETASAQVKSAILLAALVAGLEVEVTEPVRSRDHTERMLIARGARVEIEGTRVRLCSTRSLVSLDTEVPADPSSAAFFGALSALADSGSIELEGVCINPTRAEFFRALEEMGARVELLDQRDEGGEPTARIRIAPGELRGIRLDPACVPAMIDEVPLLACVAARASGETVIEGAGELRVKESDRLAVVVRNLRSIGAEAEELPDGLRVRGSHRPLRGRIETHGDHRIAMGFGILGALPGNAIEVDDPQCVDVSYPGFWEDLGRVTSS